MLKIYGIKNCNTMKKAFDALTQLGLPFEFHDYKKQGIDLDTLQHWADQVGLDLLLNKKGTTWCKFSPEQQADILSSSENTLQALKDNTSMIKRPVLVKDKQILVGFNEEAYTKLA
ncbi:Spx/MgsR family RNA polymerase-binding regulatory protein [Alkanindiges sp. WGS2144]|uniref:Spx/MgsR family RNA polymerase-binding regulatory protein n=1 Tax=Alkanindiges sp. WGS2144 TaxID=3366808 RepID=UPI00375040DC